MQIEEIVERYKNGELYDYENADYKQLIHDIQGDFARARTKAKMAVYKRWLDEGYRDRIGDRFVYIWYVIRSNVTPVIREVERMYPKEEIYTKDSDNNFFGYVDQRCIVINGITKKHNQFEAMVDKWLDSGCRRLMSKEYYRKVFTFEPVVNFRNCSVIIISRKFPKSELKSRYYGIQFRVETVK